MRSSPRYLDRGLPVFAENLAVALQFADLGIREIREDDAIVDVVAQIARLHPGQIAVAEPDLDRHHPARGIAVDVADMAKDKAVVAHHAHVDKLRTRNIV